MAEEIKLSPLAAIQRDLKAPKNQHNSFGNYDYRNAEDILEAVKPLLAKHSVELTMSDEVIQIGERFYVKATIVLSGTSLLPKTISVSAYAREEETKKGMDGSQITGAASSYARKYALNGLFLIDDSKDADAQGPAKPAAKTPVAAPAQALISPELMRGLKVALTGAGFMDGQSQSDYIEKILGTGHRVPGTAPQAQKVIDAAIKLVQESGDEPVA